MSKKNIIVEKIECFGDFAVELFHLVGLFTIGATIVWAAVVEYIHIMDVGHASLKDILLLFIYLELGAMVGIYFKTHRLPVQFLLYIAITALTRLLAIDVKAMENLSIVTVTGSILLLTIAILFLQYGNKKFGSEESGTA
jgi:phosphate starvation-inducible membrane PsiE